MRTGSCNLVLAVLFFAAGIANPSSAEAKCAWAADSPQCQEVAVEIVRCKPYENPAQLVESGKYRKISKDIDPPNALELAGDEPRLDLYVKITSAKAAKCDPAESVIYGENEKITLPSSPVLLYLPSEGLTCEKLGTSETFHISKCCPDTGDCGFYASAKLIR